MALYLPGWTAKNPTLPVGSVSCVPQKRVTFGRPAAYLARASAGLGVPCPIRREKLRSEDVRIQKSGEYLNILNRSATTYGYGSKNQTANAWGESTTISGGHPKKLAHKKQEPPFVPGTAFTRTNLQEFSRGRMPRYFSTVIMANLR